MQSTHRNNKHTQSVWLLRHLLILSVFFIFLTRTSMRLNVCLSTEIDVCVLCILLFAAHLTNKPH